MTNDSAPSSIQAAKRRAEADQFEDLLVTPSCARLHLGRLRTPPQVLYHESVLARDCFASEEHRGCSGNF